VTEKTPRKLNLKLTRLWIILGVISIMVIAVVLIFISSQSGSLLGKVDLTATTVKKMVQLQTQVAATLQKRAALQKTAEFSLHATMTAKVPTATPTPIPTPTHIPTATPKAGTMRVSAKDNMILIYIPAGEFIMGSTDEDRDAGSEEKPAHKVYLDAYWIDQTQVTNAMYAACVQAGACIYHTREAINPRYYEPAFADHPVVYVVWQEAMDYCAWQGGRLPTEAEWEKAARGPQESRYAWGDQLPNSNLVNIHNLIGDTTQVGLFPRGKSYYGALDMGGNVREWVFDWYSLTYYQNSPYKNPKGPDIGEKKVLKGAAYSDPFPYARVANRLAHVPDSPGNVRGFRCMVP
jgi:formylglycine-generating enzyme required for sulfatase activity